MPGSAPLVTPTAQVRHARRQRQRLVDVVGTLSGARTISCTAMNDVYRVSKP